MATQRSQRLGIIIILVALVVGTLGSFAVMVLGTQNQQKDAANQQKIIADYQKQYQAYQDKVAAQVSELSNRYYPTFSSYAPRVGEFDAGSVTGIQKEDLEVGEGAEIGDSTKFAAYYIGWNPKGKIFDQSIQDSKLKAPFTIDPGLAQAGVITGWKEGLKGMKIGGVREITIPSDKAYGEPGQGDDIPPNTPLKFVVMAIEAPAQIDPPAAPASLMQQGYGGI